MFIRKESCVFEDKGEHGELMVLHLHRAIMTHEDAYHLK